MSDSIPSAHATDDAPAPGHANTNTNAEDRKAAAALSSLNTTQIAADADAALKPPPSAADQEALGKAMSRLEIAAGVGHHHHHQGQAGRKTMAQVQQQQQHGGGRRVVPNVRVAAEDVNLLVEELDLSKGKATELLRMHEGNVVLAMRAFVAAG
ncbi:hypothetical protein BO71DRAFT_404542 [Aspergillus ellipticus CBS 707.79]|uniref:Nascent polypeptide-associated complex subunit alpha-like UBA domain-containing protein n=1 Tax=Aspergillus ellipticus CBS 707.79 TaxID=1448320 RepID=A0A319CQU1_9EURO|nr:hypothetical protein BO71DRAFT_404542 [Aspergillus ellipticus CBS 707.79]